MKLAWVVLAFLVQDSAAPQDIVEVEAKELKEAWTRVIELCRAEKREELQKLIEAMELTREEIVALFGEEKAARLYPLYEDAWKKQVLVEAVPDLIEKCKRGKWTDVDVWCLNTKESKDMDESDRAVVSALLSREEGRLFNIRLHEKGRTDGLVLRCFVKSKAGWKMGLKLGRYFLEK